jgi:hypothetical protein
VRRSPMTWNTASAQTAPKAAPAKKEMIRTAIHIWSFDPASCFC